MHRNIFIKSAKGSSYVISKQTVTIDAHCFTSNPCPMACSCIEAHCVLWCLPWSTLRSSSPYDLRGHYGHSRGWSG